LDMSMHEINTVAETITAAADTEANIIFGASINPDLEGEIIVTVIATGFDDSYYASRNAKTAKLLRQTVDEGSLQPLQVDEQTMADIDMEIKEPVETGADDFHKDETPNIWALGHDEDSHGSQPAVEDDEIDKPSFLRRHLKFGGKAKPEDGADLSKFGEVEGEETSVSNDEPEADKKEEK
jgi:cell division protein FtsZ